MTHRFGTLLFLLVALIGVACVDMSAPSGAASISVLQLPSPSVVLGDVMRDSNGVPAPLTVIAYDANNAPVSGLGAQFFITDSQHIAHIDASNIVTGDKIGVTHLIGQVGSLQTAVALVPVTYAPDHIVAGKADSLDVPLGADSATSIATLALPVSVKSSQDSAAQGFIVRYVITHAPPSTGATPAVYLANDFGKTTTADTSDASGTANPKLVVNSFFMTDRAAIYARTKKDSVVVEASSKYKGVALNGSPLRFVVKVTVSLK